MEEITEKTSTIFAKGPSGYVEVHVIPKGDYPKTRTWIYDHGRWKSDDKQKSES